MVASKGRTWKFSLPNPDILSLPPVPPSLYLRKLRRTLVVKRSVNSVLLPHSGTLLSAQIADSDSRAEQ